MPDEKPQLTEIQSIPLDAIIDIKVSGAYYGALQQMFMDVAMTKSEAEFKAVMERLKLNEKPKDKYERHLSLLLSLAVEIENAAKAQGKVLKKEVDLSNLKPVDP